MANYFNLTLDTTAPTSPSIVLDGGATYATTQLIDATIGVDDADTTGYQMLIWGDVDTTENTSIQDTEVDSSWISYSTTQQIKLSSGDGAKTINLRVRDDVLNESSQTSDSIELNTSLPIVSVSGVDTNRISKISGANVSSFSFSVDVVFDEYKVKVVSSTGTTHDSGTQIPETAGSTNMSGVAGAYPAATNIDASITGTDLETASAGDGEKIIKVFVKDEAGNWSV